jgi:hypothetical protein
MKRAIILESSFNKKECVETMETILFTNLIESQTKSRGLSENFKELNLLAKQFNYKAQFCPFFMVGKPKDIVKTKNLLYKSIKYN